MQSFLDDCGQLPFRQHGRLREALRPKLTCLRDRFLSQFHLVSSDDAAGRSAARCLFGDAALALSALRSAAGFVSLLLYFYAISSCRWGDSGDAAYTSPLFLAIYLGRFRQRACAAE